MITSKIADACVEGQERRAEKQQAEADKEYEEESEPTAVGAELKPGERKVISDGTEGPVVEIIKRSKAESAQQNAPVEDFEELEEAQAQEANGEDTSEVEKTGE